MGKSTTGEALVGHSGYIEARLIPIHKLLIENLLESDFDKKFVGQKYLNKESNSD